jgi:hypothetical protein
VLRDAVADGAVPRLDVETAPAQLLGPLVYRRLLTSEPLDEDLCAGLVEDFLRSRTSRR